VEGNVGVLPKRLSGTMNTYQQVDCRQKIDEIPGYEKHVLLTLPRRSVLSINIKKLWCKEWCRKFVEYPAHHRKTRWNYFRLTNITQTMLSRTELLYVTFCSCKYWAGITVCTFVEETNRSVKQNMKATCQTQCDNVQSELHPTSLM